MQKYNQIKSKSQTSSTSPLPRQGKPSSLEKQVNELELKVAYHERLNQDLSDQVYSLHKEVDSLREIVNSLKAHLRRGNKEQLEIGPADESPPHY